ncbi:MAG: hypothetical protein HYY16_05680 [Planctomycetes bacterium]|nr:hypothetical protein [Planctomycetota bacterium]
MRNVMRAFTLVAAAIFGAGDPLDLAGRAPSVRPAGHAADSLVGKPEPWLGPIGRTDTQSVQVPPPPVRDSE